MVDLNAIGEGKNWIERPGDTLLRQKGSQLIKAVGIKDGESSRKASLAIAAAEGLYSAFREPKQRYNQALDLPTRGSLRLNFGGPWGPPDQDTAIIPFYENPEISEENIASYATRNIFGRNSPLRNFTHSGPRIITLKIPYLLDHLRAFNYHRIVDYLDLYDNIVGYIKEYEEVILGEINEAAVKANEGFFNNVHRKVEGLIDKYARVDLSPQGIKDKYKELFGGPNVDPIYDLLAAYYAIIQLVRSSVLTSTKDPWKKPPVAILRYGALYENIQCIVTNYSISYDENDGFDVNTLLPRRIEFTLRLEEYAPLPSKRSDYNQFYEIEGYDDLLKGIQSRDEQRRLNQQADIQINEGLIKSPSLKEQLP